MRGTNDYCIECAKGIGDGFAHLDRFPSHRVFSDKKSADKAPPPMFVKVTSK